MQRWRGAYDDGVARFVCICVDGRPEETAREFQQLYFDDTMTNAFIDDPADFPTFQAQLGCQGFVVLDARGRFATQRTIAFLDYRGAAFEAVERMLEPLIAAAKASSRPPDSGSVSSGVAPSRTAATTTAPAHAVFSENACSDAPVDIDAAPEEGEDDDDDDAYRLESVGHDAMDADHARLERLMRAALASRTKADVVSLRDDFAAHAAREETLMRAAEEEKEKSSNGGGGGGGGGGAAFSAAASHALDHERIWKLATATSNAVGREGLVPETAVRRVCRAIVEHAVTYDSVYAGTLPATV